MTAHLPRPRNPAAPAPFAARWRELAACRGADLNLFFPGRGQTAGPAREICGACPVRQACLDYALSNAITHGIWGGLSERERRGLRTSYRRSVRRSRDRDVIAAAAAGHTVPEISRSFSLSRTSVTRIVRTESQPDRSGHSRITVQAPFAGGRG